MPEGAAVLTIEFKINLLAPAQGQRFRMEGRVLEPWRTITVLQGRAWAIDHGVEELRGHHRTLTFDGGARARWLAEADSPPGQASRVPLFHPPTFSGDIPMTRSIRRP